MDHQQKAQLKSVVSSLVSLINSMRENAAAGADARNDIMNDVMDIIDTYQPDATSWGNPEICSRYFYDVYLAMRKECGELTDFDMTRPGLTMANFTEGKEYHQHCIRVGEARSTAPYTEEVGMKTCTTCGETKSLSKFKRGGGSKCYSCLGKAYRARKSEERS